MRLGLVVNPRARGASDPQLPARLQALCQRAQVDCELLVSPDAHDLPRRLAALCAKPLDVLLVCGGDGTLMTTLSAAVRASAVLPALLPLPAGTMNTVAKNLGLPPRPEALLEALLRGASHRGLSAVPYWPQETLRVLSYGETPHQRTPLPAQPAQPTQPTQPTPDEAALGMLPQRERHGFVFSGAMGARFLSAYASVPQPGLRWALVLAARTIASCLYPGGGKLARWLFQPTPMRIYVDRDGDKEREPPVAPPELRELPELIDAPFRLLLLATVADVGLGMRVPWRAGCVPGRFQLIASAISTMDNAMQLPRIWRGQPMHGAPHHDRLTRGARLRFAGAQPLVLDGELFCAPAVDVELGPRLRVLRPSLLAP